MDQGPCQLRLVPVHALRAWTAVAPAGRRAGWGIVDRESQRVPGRLRSCRLRYRVCRALRACCLSRREAGQHQARQLEVPTVLTYGRFAGCSRRCGLSSEDRLMAAHQIELQVVGVELLRVHRDVLSSWRRGRNSSMFRPHLHVFSVFGSVFWRSNHIGGRPCASCEDG